MQYPEAYIAYLIEFHATRDYFECHELLEDYWKEQEPGQRQSIWVVLIQIAVGCYHYRRNNLAGAKKMLEKAEANLQAVDREKLRVIGMGEEGLLELIQSQHQRVLDGKLYAPFALPLNDQELITHCREACNRLGLVWNNSLPVPEEIKNRHLYRGKMYESRQGRFNGNN
ncbi:DUF309 domain-containing protein [Bacillus testis]|uniref:DUF309 domain-containing protein n=1 Tax=Bacillus testis TaxID=1622072 RepID=UPI00067EF185|nr:DUF309 domain-containing protein [Bacillus testis]